MSAFRIRVLLPSHQVAPFAVAVASALLCSLLRSPDRPAHSRYSISLRIPPFPSLSCPRFVFDFSSLRIKSPLSQSLSRPRSFLRSFSSLMATHTHCILSPFASPRCIRASFSSHLPPALPPIGASLLLSSPLASLQVRRSSVTAANKARLPYRQWIALDRVLSPTGRVTRVVVNSDV